MSARKNSKLSVIITTYNQPKWLELCLESYRNQTYKEFEILIADDGSSEETKKVISFFSDIVTKHIWHEDRGFRKTKILNEAIKNSKTEYIIFTDGDCIARHDLVETHYLRRKKGSFLSGSYYKLDKQASKLINKKTIKKNLFRFGTLKKLGHKVKYKSVKFLAPKKLSYFLDFATPTKATWNGHCSSAWKKDILQVNGFDERMVYGGLDREFGERLVNNKIKPIQIRHQSCVIHLHHNQEYINMKGKNFNNELRARVKKQKRIWTKYGIKK